LNIYEEMPVNVQAYAWAVLEWKPPR